MDMLEIVASEIVADGKENTFIVEKNRKKLLGLLLLSYLFKHFSITNKQWNYWPIGQLVV